MEERGPRRQDGCNVGNIYVFILPKFTDQISMNSDPVAPFDGLKVWMKDIFLIRWSIQRVESGLLVKFNVFY